MITFLWFKVSNKAAFSCLSSLVLVFPIIKFTGLLYSIVCSRRPATLTAPYFSRPGPSAPLTPPSRWPPGPPPPPTTPYFSRPGPPSLPKPRPVARPAGQKIENGKAWCKIFVLCCCCRCVSDSKQQQPALPDLWLGWLLCKRQCVIGLTRHIILKL